MSHDEIIAMAREAAARHGQTLKAVPSLETTEFILELVSMAATQERERIAMEFDRRNDASCENEDPAEIIRAMGVS